MRDRGSRLKRMRAAIERESEVLRSVAAALDAQSAAAVDLLLSTSGHVLVGGAGTSNAVARRFAHLLSCSGLPALFLHPADSLHGASGAVRAADTVVLISKGGSTAEVNGFARIARQRGARLVAITENRGSALAEMADAVICVQGEITADPFGMVATASSLANCAVCDAICQMVLEETGYTAAQFAATHPGGAVGQRIRREEAAR